MKDLFCKKLKEMSNNINNIILDLENYLIGQTKMIKFIFISILSDSHILLEGNSGLGKTYIIKIISNILSGKFSRIQFTPDLIPSDIIGTEIYNFKENTFYTKKGPIFANFILADEINRASPKLQSCFLQSMEEKQVTIGNFTYNLPNPFIIFATQNPNDEEGTFPLPYAQLDRFGINFKIDYPDVISEEKILNSFLNKKLDSPSLTKIDFQYINSIKHLINNIYIDDRIKKYIVNIVNYTRVKNNLYMNKFIEQGVSTRGTIFLAKISRIVAFLDKRNYVIPDDIIYCVNEVLRHRIKLSIESLSENISSDDIINNIIQDVVVP